MTRMRARAFAIACLTCLFVWANASASDMRPDPSALRAQIEAAKASLTAHLPSLGAQLKAIPGLFSRLDSDSARLDDSLRPVWMPPDDFWAINVLTVKLDSALVAQLVSHKAHPIGLVQGADEIIYRSTSDGSWQPLALYVPASYTSAKPAPLVVFLHGNAQSEVDVIAGPGLRQLADATGAIIAAPFARGNANYQGAAGADVHEVVGLLESAYNVDRSHVYLGGMSMGGSGALHIGAQQPDDWTGILAVISGVDPADRATLGALRAKRVFIVSAAEDDEIGVGASRSAAQALRDAGAEVHYYEQPGAGHSFNSVFPSVVRAWKDMLALAVAPRVIIPMPRPSSTPEPLATLVPAAPPTPNGTFPGGKPTPPAKT